MSKLGTLTVTYGNSHLKRVLEESGYKLDFVKSGALFSEYVITDGEWNPANEDGKRVYTDSGWETVDFSE